MVRLRNAVMAFVLATGLTGCSGLHGEGNWLVTGRHGTATLATTFPSPAYGPNYSLAPGSLHGHAPGYPATGTAKFTGQSRPGFDTACGRHHAAGGNTSGNDIRRLRRPRMPLSGPGADPKD